MAKNKLILSILNYFRHFKPTFLTPLVLAFITSLLCIVVFPVLGKATAVKPSESSLKVTPSQIPNLVQQGKALYDAGQFTEAVKLLQQAVLEAEAQRDQLKQAIALSDLSLVGGVLDRLVEYNE